MLKLPTPGQFIASRKRHCLLHCPLGLAHEPTQIASSDITLNDDPSLHLFTTDLRRPRVDPNRRDTGEGNEFSVHGGDQETPERGGIRRGLVREANDEIKPSRALYHRANHV